MSIKHQVLSLNELIDQSRGQSFTQFQCSTCETPRWVPAGLLPKWDSLLVYIFIFTPVFLTSELIFPSELLHRAEKETMRQANCYRVDREKLKCAQKTNQTGIIQSFSSDLGENHQNDPLKNNPVHHIWSCGQVPVWGLASRCFDCSRHT